MRYAILKTLVIVLSLVSITSLSFAQENTNTQNESVTRQKRVQKSKYFDKFKTINTHLLGSNDHQMQIAGRYAGAQVAAKSTDPALQTEFYSNQTTMTGGFQYLYGVSENISLGGDLAYASSSFESTTYYIATTENYSSKSEAKGLSGANLRAQFGFDMGSFGLFTDISYAPKIGTASRNSVTNEENNYPEQAALSLKNSLVMSSGGIKYGGFLNYTHNFEGDTETVNTSTTRVRKVTGGNSAFIGAFTEFTNFYNLNLSAALANSAGKTYTNQDGTIDTDNLSQDYVNLAASLDLKIDTSTSVLPVAEYVTVISKRRGIFDFDRVHLYGFSLALRKVF
jgi:hypothetical protein